jgi:hypothetical protein
MVAPLQLPGPLVVPPVDWSGLNQIGDALMRRGERQREAEAFGGLVEAIPTRGEPPQTAPGGQPGGPPGGQLPRGLRNNNPGNIEDGPLAKSLPGYKGSDGRFAIFETPEHGLGAMDALLTSYGRRGLKTVGEVIGRWAPKNDGNNVDAYSRFVSSAGDPNETIDLSDPAQRKRLIGKMAIFENGMHAGAPREGVSAPVVPPSAADVAAAQRGMPADMKKRVQALFAVGTPAATQVALGLVSKFIGKQEPIKLGEGDVLIDPDTGKVVGRAPGKSQSVRAGGAIVQDGKVVYQAPAADAGNKIDEQVKQRAAIAEQKGMDPNDEVTRKWVLTGQMDIKPAPGEKIEDLIVAREAQAKRMGLDPADERTRSFILTGKMPGEDKMPITPTDKKAIIEADEHVLAHEQTIKNLADLKELSKKAWGFVGSAPASRVLAPVSQGAQDTAELNTTATTNALNQLKAVFGGAPTEGERKILLDIQGSSAMPDPLRQKVYDRAIAAVEKRLELAKRQSEGLRDRTYWKPGGGTKEAQPTRPPPPQIGTPEFDALPAGGLYQAPDGSVRAKRAQ